MANLYVRSTDGSDTDNGTTWALAKATIVGAAGIDAAGDVINVSGSHAGSFTTAQTLNLAGTLANPVMVIGANDGAEPPTAEAAASETITNNNAYTINGAVRWRGVNITVGVTGGSSVIQFGNNAAANDKMVFENCTFRTDGSGSNSNLQIGSTSNTFYSHVVWRNVTYYPTNSTGSDNKAVKVNLGVLEWNGGGLHASSSAIVGIVAQIGLNGRAGAARLRGLDLSYAGATVQIFPSSGIGYGSIANCKLPASWTGTLCGSAITAPGYECELVDCTSGTTRIRYRKHTNSGDIRDDTGIYLTAGTYDGVANVSYKFTANAGSTNTRGGRLVGPNFAVWNATDASSVTASVEVAYDSATTLTDKELWLEASTLQTDGSGLGTWVSSENTNALSSGTSLTTVSTSWTGTGGWSNEKKHTLSLTFTPNEKGPVMVRVVYAKASGPAVYVDPAVTLT